MMRKILLVEPNYQNKYPPIGLMKIATYYRKLGDDVTFFKGDLNNLVLDITYSFLLKQLYANDSSVFWEIYKPQFCNFILTGIYSNIDSIKEVNDSILIKKLLKYYHFFYKNKYYFHEEFRIFDVVAITTLFTFYWEITINTINFVKKLCKDENNVFVGGILATLLPEDVKAETGIMPHLGTLSESGILDKNDIIVDTLPLDYSILEEIDYSYPTSDSYFFYTTRGCINKCKFCAVPKIEPIYNDYISIYNQIKYIDDHFGKKKDLLLLDNNVLASDKYETIINEIKLSGFTNESYLRKENMYEIAIKNIKNGYNEKGYIKAVVKEYKKLIKRFGLKVQYIYDILEKKNLFNYYTAKKDDILNTYDILHDLFNDLYSFYKPRMRYVDFNQGLDSRLINNSNMKKMSEIPIRPLRIAFDHWNLRDKYENAVRIAVSNGQKHLSNYVLYNFNDTPLELYQRLKLNIDLCEELSVDIYSFPMKYHPIDDPKFFKNRDYIGKNWNRKFIRAVQAILNSTKGKIGRGKFFFEKAFGVNEEEYFKILIMPEPLIIYRLHYEKNGITDDWWESFSNLSQEEKKIILPIIYSNNFSNYNIFISNKKCLNVLSFYKITRDKPS